MGVDLVLVSTEKGGGEQLWTAYGLPWQERKEEKTRTCTAASAYKRNKPRQTQKEKSIISKF